MKWSEFKKQVDEKLKELGVDDPKIAYIDIGVSKELEVYYRDELNDFWVKDKY